MPPDVFISHSAKDREVADAVCRRLESEGVGCWIAHRDIVPGQTWGAAIIRAIERSRVMVLVFSTHANESPQVLREVERAVDHGVVIIPFRIADVRPSGSLEYFISSSHWLDALPRPGAAHLDRLVPVVQARLAGDTEPAPPPAPAAAAPPGRRWLGYAVGGGLLALLLAVWLLVGSGRRDAPDALRTTVDTMGALDGRRRILHQHLGAGGRGDLRNALSPEGLRLLDEALQRAAPDAPPLSGEPPGREPASEFEEAVAAVRAAMRELRASLPVYRGRILEDQTVTELEHRQAQAWIDRELGYLDVLGEAALVHGLRQLRSSPGGIPSAGRAELERLSGLDLHALRTPADCDLRLGELAIEAARYGAPRTPDATWDRLARGPVPEALRGRFAVEADDPWVRVVGVAIAARKLGLTEESLRAFDAYGDMFADTYASARHYARAGKRLTSQREAFGGRGGVYVYEIQAEGTAARAGLAAGSIILRYAGIRVDSVADLLREIERLPAEKTVVIEWADLTEDGVLERRRSTLANGDLGILIMPI